jgi:hypothetical protein
MQVANAVRFAGVIAAAAGLVGIGAIAVAPLQ